MECSNTKLIKPNPNISEIVSKLAKVCTLKSIGVFSSELPNLHHLHKPVCDNASVSGNTSSVASDDNRSHGQKIHPHPIEFEVPKGEGFCAGLEIMKIFDVVSAIKLAYLELQQAHIPYDPHKVVSADKRVSAELEKLCKFKVEYKEKQCRIAMLNAGRFDRLRSEIKAKEALLGKLKGKNNVKDSKILRLRQELHDLEMVNKNLTEKIKRINKMKNASVSTVAKFHEQKWIENDAVYVKRGDKKYAFEAYIARRMFHGVSLRSYDVGDVVKFDDPIDALMENPGSDFSKFCRTKYLLVVHRTMEESFFGNLDHRSLVSNGKHPRTEFYQLFTKMAKWVWVLLGSAASIDPNATMFYTDNGSMFSSLYMESVNVEREIAEQGTYSVQFMIMPGIKIGQTLVKSQVYISKQSEAL
ncbi:protein GRAVITROPIC IN THE LIGHT 1-like [Arachis stenosperma]|uniref:protein GRAVITROPIC IN THE LIGHT 1-like n=1 Tax=Arachis stenosperma TaxID=217475 RepID=UPI0025ACA7EC|nr:protein GRAVITROPIC IN THE LIGHT 1-like [Arachis stenosperma]